MAPVASVALPSPPSGVSAGPAVGELAANLVNGNCVVVDAPQIVRTIDACGWIDWVPGSEWIVYGTTSEPTIQGTRVTGVTAEHADGSSPTAVVCPSSVPAFVQPLPGPTLAYACGSGLDILPLGRPSPKPTVYAWPHFPARPGPLLFSVDPTRTDVAVVQPNGWVDAYRLADGVQLPGTYQGGNPSGMAWSANGTIAIASSQGVTFWHPGVGVHTAAAAANDNILQWLPDSSGVLAISSFRPAVLPPGYLVKPDGSAREIIRPDSGQVLYGWTSDGHAYWHGPSGVYSGKDVIAASGWS